MRRPKPALPPWLPLAAAGGLFAAALAGQAMVEGDTLWHIKAGEWILAHRAVPRADPFSWTARGLPWHAHEWLWEALAALAYGALGKWGVWLLLLAGVGAYALGLAALLRALGAGRAAAGLAAAAAAVFSAPQWSARPHVLAAGLFAVWAWLAAGPLGRARPLGAAVAGALFAALWANVHASAPLAPAVPLLLALGDPDRGRRIRMLAAAFGAALGTLANPWGPGIWAFAAKVSSDRWFAEHIGEWFSPDFKLAWNLPALALILALALAPALRAAPPGRARWLAAAALAMFLRSERWLPWFLLGGLAALVPEASGRGEARPLEAACRILAACLAASALLLLPPAWTERPKEPLPYPLAAIEAMKRGGVTERVFNYYSWGGILVWEGIAPAVDGRADMYRFSGSGVLEDYADVFHLEARFGSDPEAVLDRRGALAVLAPAGSAPDAVLARSPRWRLFYRDGVAAVYVRARDAAGKAG